MARAYSKKYKVTLETEGVDGSWLSIRWAATNEGEWEYGEEDSPYYCSGGFWTDELVVTDYDGAYSLHPKVIAGLELLGFDCKEVK